MAVLTTVIITFFATIIGGVLAIKNRRRIGFLAAFTAGILIGLSIFELLPEIFTLTSEIQASIEGALITIAAGFISLYLIDRHFFQPRKLEQEHKRNYRPSLGLLAASEFCSHAFLEGMTIGFSFQFNWQLGISVSVAVISLDFCDGLTTVTLMLSTGNTIKASVGMLLLDATAPILGAAVTIFLTLEYYYLIFFLSFIAGAFLYIGAGNLLPLAHRENPKSVTVISLIFGLLILIFILSKLTG